LAPKHLLQAIVIFSDLSGDDVEAISRLTAWTRYPRKRQIMAEGDPTTDVFFVVEGRIEAKSYSPLGKEVTYIEVEQGGLFGEFSAIDGEPRSATIVAIEPSMIGRMTADNFRATLLAYPPLHMRVTELLVMKARSLSRRIYEFSTLAVRIRVQAELLRLAKSVDGQPNQATVQPAPTHHEFATRVSTHREAVTRELNYLASIGLLELGNRRIAILDVDRLRHMVEDSQLS
jgi:CRP/FNR family transcriptional regulator, cyclic AMP receptor protein